MLRERRENTGAENLGKRTGEDNVYNVYTCVFRMCVNSCTYVCLYVLGAVCGRELCMYWGAVCGMRGTLCTERSAT